MTWVHQFSLMRQMVIGMFHTDGDGTTGGGSGIYNALVIWWIASFGSRTNVSFFKRNEDARSIDEKLYKLRVVVPKEFDNAKNPEEGFIIQESGSTAARTNADFSLATMIILIMITRVIIDL